MNKAIKGTLRCYGEEYAYVLTHEDENGNFTSSPDSPFTHMELGRKYRIYSEEIKPGIDFDSLGSRIIEALDTTYLDGQTACGNAVMRVLEEAGL